MNRPSAWTVARVAQSLQVRYPDIEQDWGITNADATRLGEFVTYYERHAATFDTWSVEFYLGELLMESANDALRDGLGDPTQVQAAVSAVVALSLTEPTSHLLEYWTALDLPDEEQDDAGNSEFWPIANLLRQALASQAVK